MRIFASSQAKTNVLQRDTMPFNICLLAQPTNRNDICNYEIAFPDSYLLALLALYRKTKVIFPQLPKTIV